MRMHHDPLFNIPLSIALITSGFWLRAFESGSWFLGTLLPYIGFAVGIMQIVLLSRKIRHPK